MIGPCTSYTFFRGSCIFQVSNIIVELRELIQVIIFTLIFFCWRSNFKNSCFVFHRGFKHSQTIKALGLRPRAFISFLVFETPMKHSHSFLKYYVAMFFRTHNTMSTYRSSENISKGEQRRRIYLLAKNLCVLNLTAKRIGGRGELVFYVNVFICTRAIFE